jgi:acyl-CoA thioester hydrolase
MSKTPPQPRSAYRWWLPIQTRWNDNDSYGHVNNMVYYGYLDTAVNVFLIREGGLDFLKASVIGIVAESGFRFRRSVGYPDLIEVGLRIGHLGTRSARYECGIFGPGDETASAEGFFVHVFVERDAMSAVSIPEPIRAALVRIQFPGIEVAAT